MATENWAMLTRRLRRTDPARAPRETLPTMYDLPSEDPEEPGLPDEFHDFQPQLLRDTFRPMTVPPEQCFIGTDMNLYYDLEHLNWHKRPDWFAVLGVSSFDDQQQLRLSYVIWQELVAPYLVVELLSPGTEKEDLGETTRDPAQPPTKWEVYERILRIPYYVVFSRYTHEARYFKINDGRYQEAKPTEQRLWLSEAGLGLGVWSGVYQRVKGQWLRFYDKTGAWIPTPEEQAREQAEQAMRRERQERERAEQERERAEQERERAEQERERAERARQAEQQERERAERLAAQLKALGVEPEP